MSLGPTCWACGGTPHTRVWEITMCLECASAWRSVPGFDWGEMGGMELGLEAVSEKYRIKTEAWARARRARAA